MLIAFSLLLSSYLVPADAFEPGLTEILTHLGFTHVAEVTVETFPLGTYNITLYAEFAQYYDENELSFYQVNTSSFNVIFTGPEGGLGYITPTTKTFTADYQFGLSLSRTNTLPYRYFTETSRNPSGTQYAKVYKNLDTPSMFLIGFDERTYCNGTGDKDYNDMVFSLQLQHYLSVISPYDTPSGEGWYYNGTKAFASLANGIIDYGNGTRAIFTHWSGDASGTNYSKSEPICMDQNKTAIANWKIQYYLTVTSSYGSPTPTSKWFDKGTNITASVVTPWAGPTGTRYLCTGWAGTGSVPTSGTLSTINFAMNQPSSITWNWKTQYLLTVLIDPTGLSPQPTRNPTGEAGPTNGWWYDTSINVALTAQSVTGYTFNYWDVEGTSQGNGVNPITMYMNAPHTATAHYASAPPPPPLSVSISPLSASIYVGGSVTFTSLVSGGTTPYSYQWYLNDALVSGVTSSSWAFTPATSGTYYVYLKVTDAGGNAAQSETARILVASVPVGGYSTSLAKQTPTSSITAYTMSIALFTVALSLTKRKRK
jgi:hypothetical protein